MTRRRTLACFLLLLSSAAALAQTKQASKTTNDPDKKEWIQLFNGKDLKDWTPKITGYDLNDNFGNTFRVENGVMKVGYEKYDKFDNASATSSTAISFHTTSSPWSIASSANSRKKVNWATRNSG